MKTRIKELLLTAAISTSIVSVVVADPDYGDFDIARSILGGSGIDFNEASKRIAQDYPGQIIRYELEEEDDRLVHEFKVVQFDEKVRYKVEIDAQTGEVKEEKEELKSSLFKKNKYLKLVNRMPENALSIEDAVALVQQDIPEGTNMLLADVELEYEQGLLYFEVDMEDEEGETEWLVDVTTKQLIPTFKQD